MSLAFAYIRLRVYLLGLKRKRKRELYKAEDGSTADMDRTGRVVDGAEIIKTEIDPAQRVVFLFNDNAVAYSYWRSQELSLFWRALPDFQSPILDFGCGDGSFSKCLLDHVDYGVDIDPSALAIAAQYKGLYDHLISFDQMSADMPAGSIGSVYSCSVLEHTIDIQTCLREISRVLKPGGKLYFTVPSPHFTEHMAKLADRAFADMMNEGMYHRNMFDQARWTQLIGEAGLAVEEFLPFQPFAFTKGYFLISLLGNRTVGRIPGFRAWFWKRYKARLMKNVADSINGGVADGANFFVVAVKPSAQA